MLLALCACTSEDSGKVVADTSIDAAVDAPVDTRELSPDSGKLNSCHKTYGLSFPPFATAEQMDFTVDQLAALGIDRIRIAISWNNREPTEGQYHWEPFDARIQKAKEHGIRVFLTVPSDGPDWACTAVRNDKSCVFTSDQVFENYLTTLFARYPQSIDKIQFGNEWDTSYAGSMEEFVRFNNILYGLTKKLSPNTTVVLGGLTRGYPMVELVCNQQRDLDFSNITFADGWSEDRLLARLRNEYCGGDLKNKVLYVLAHASYDTLDIHLYDDPSNWAAYVAMLPQDKGIVVSEFGGPSSVFEKTDQTYQANRLEAYLRAIEALPIEEAYYFKLVDSDYSYHKHSGLFDDKLQKKQAYSVFADCMEQ